MVLNLPHALASPSTYKNKSFVNSKGNAAYVEFIQQTLSALVIASWTEGAKIVKLGAGQANAVTSGTAISTFVNGKYPQGGSTGKHAAIHLGQDATGIQVLEQWKA